jgi:hypothetical protein
MIEMHHDIAIEAHHRAAVDDVQAVGAERAIGQLDVDMLLGIDRTLAMSTKA